MSGLFRFVSPESDLIKILTERKVHMARRFEKAPEDPKRREAPSGPVE